MSSIQRYQAHDRKSEIVELTWPTKDEIRQILAQGRIEHATIKIECRKENDEFTAKAIENRVEREISWSEYSSYKDNLEKYDFIYDEISHPIHTNGIFKRTINELSPLASLIRYFAENHYPSCSAEIAEYIYNSGSKKKASLVRQQIQHLRKIHPNIIINVRPYKRYTLNADLNTLFILAD